MSRFQTSPSDIEVLIHFYVSPEPHPRRHTPAVEDAIAMFEKDEILKRINIGSGYTVTDKGVAWLNMILETPYPEKIWIDPRNKKNES